MLLRMASLAPGKGGEEEKKRVSMSTEKGLV